MKYNYICLAGVIPMTVFGYLWKSKIMLFVSLIGYIFHTNPHNKVIKYIDLSVNVSFTLYAIVIEKKPEYPPLFQEYVTYIIIYYTDQIILVE